jgi:hypothetical protein
MNGLESNKNQGIERILIRIYIVVILLVFSLMVLSFPAGLYVVFFTRLSESLTIDTPIYSIFVPFIFLPFNIPVNSTIGYLFLTLSVLYGILFSAAALQEMRILSAMRNAISSGFDHLFRNTLIGTIMSLGAMIFGLSMLNMIQTRIGVPTGSISGDPLNLFLGVTIAPLTEELGFRFSPIGLPLFFILILTRASTLKALKTLWRPSAAWQTDGLGSGDGRRKFAYFLLIISSILFGIAHLISGSGWQVGKVSEATIAGMVLGHLYIRYGLHSSVLLHWGVNYFGTTYAFLSQVLWGIPWTSETGSTLTLFVELVLIWILGLSSFLIFTYKFLKRVFMADSGIKKIDGNRQIDTKRIG